MKNIFLSAAFFTAYILFFVPVASADASCQPIYGGGQTCVQKGAVVINKKVQNPQNGNFADSLSINDPKFGPDQTVNFQITLTNTGGTMISQTTVKDIFPQFVSFASGPGNFDGNSNTLSFTVDNLNPNESRTFSVSGKVVSTGTLPVNQGTACVVNQALAHTNDGQDSTDNSQFCIENKVVPTQIPTTTKGGLKVLQPQPVTTTPSTGPEMLPLIGLIPTALAGLFLRKRSK
ncbi:MAG: hypothetical protein Q8P80_03010 [Candidatus Levybacteria bacterium]|nr:hypothetical protein [Candidatus Levybacteria bacterium]